MYFVATKCSDIYVLKHPFIALKTPKTAPLMQSKQPYTLPQKPPHNHLPAHSIQQLLTTFQP